jgi:hypothetical protein
MTSACTFLPIIEMPTAMTGIWRRVAVHLFEGKLTLDDMDRLDELGAAWRKKAPGKMIELVVIYPTEAQLSPEERKRMAAIIKRWEGDRVASSTVVLAEGLLGSFHRSVLTGLQMLAPSPHPLKVFGTIAAATQWLTPFVRDLCGPDVSAESLTGGVDELCARFAARGSGKMA